MPPVVVTRTRKSETAFQGLPYRQEMIPFVEGSADFLREYRLHAWEDYERLPLPTTSEEAWRRTDIRSLSNLE